MRIILQNRDAQPIEDALRESEGKYRMLMEQASDGIHTYDLEGNFTDVNSKLCEMLGYTRDEMLRLNVNDLVPLEELAVAPIRYDDLRAGQTIISERHVRRKDGSLLPVEISGKMLQPGVLLGIVRDISERKAAQEKLRKSERFAYSTLDALSEHIAVVDDTGVIIATNKAWRDFAASQDAAIPEVGDGMNYLAVCQRSGTAGCSDGDTFAAGLREIINNTRNEFSLEYACDTTSERLWFLARVTRFDDEGLARIVVAHENITAQKRIEEKLKRSEGWLRAIFEASRDGIVVEDNEHVIYVNNAYTRLFGYERPDEITGKHISFFISSEDRERMLEYGKQRVRGEPVLSVYEFKGRCKDGALIDLEASVSVTNIGGKDYITTAVRDIAERKRAEQALRQAKDELEKRVEGRTADLAQAIEVLKSEINERKQVEEMRRELLRRLVTAQEEERRRIARELHDQMGQHLTAMLLSLKSLKDSHHEWEAGAQEHFQQLQQIGDQLVQQVHHLAWELRPTALDDIGLLGALANYVEEWGERFRMTADFHSIGFDHQRLAPQVETTLYRIVQESLTNVVKHAEANRVSVIIELKRDHVFTLIEDNGRGFDIEAAMHTPVKQRTMGVLGMRERAALVGGTVNIESAPRKGTTVYVRIPVGRDANGSINQT